MSTALRAFARPTSDLRLPAEKVSDSWMMSQTSDQLLQKILDFVRAETGTRKQISDESDIAGDLGVDGDDAREFMLAFQRAFDVDLSGFEFDRHFGPEGLSLTRLVLTVLRLRRPQLPLTIATLVDAARQKRWPNEATSIAVSPEGRTAPPEM
ncbi:DUF1493 family protein [Bradyrhizobium sp. HKCCYLRH2060]|uniref:DUF1493 family protein n=1 Tax=Bradyrhizobium TaxID=374 RepID=UPI00291664B5|nr:DUF1493 family protein [Bradyrhizobium sp. SZCCHNR3003]